MKKSVYHHFLVEHKPAVTKTVESKVDDICVHLMPDLSLVSRRDNVFALPKDKCLILSVNMPYCRNDTEDVISVSVQITNNRTCMFSISPGAHGPVPAAERELYKPNFMNLGFDVIPYVGMENAILNAHSSVVCERGDNSQLELFKYSDPFLCFLKDHKTHFPEVEIKLTEIPNICAVSKSAVGRVQSFFKQAIFPLFEYTETPTLDFSFTPDRLKEQPSKTDNGGGIIIILLKVEYIVVKKDLPKFECKINNLGI